MTPRTAVFAMHPSCASTGRGRRRQAGPQLSRARAEWSGMPRLACTHRRGRRRKVLTDDHCSTPARIRLSTRNTADTGSSRRQSAGKKEHEERV